MLGIAQVVGHGPGARLHGRKTSKPCVGGVSGVLCADFARARAAFAGLVPVPETGRTFPPLARSGPASAAVAAMIVLPRAFGDEPSVRSKPCWASTDALVPLTEYWLTGGRGVSAADGGGAEAASRRRRRPVRRRTRRPRPMRLRPCGEPCSRALLTSCVAIWSPPPGA